MELPQAVMVVLSGLLATGLLAAFGATVWAGVVRWVWGKFNGSELPPRVAVALMLPSLAQVAWSAASLVFGAGLPWPSSVPIVALGGTFALATLVGLLRPRDPPVPREPRRLRVEIGRWVIPLDHRPAWVALGLYAGTHLTGWFWAPLLVWANWIFTGPTVSIGPAEVEVARRRGPPIRLPLAGLRVARGHRWDGSAVLRLGAGAEEIVLPVGGHDASELAWLVAELEHRAEATPAGALPEPIPEPPGALRELVGAARGGGA